MELYDIIQNLYDVKELLELASADHPADQTIDQAYQIIYNMLEELE